MKLKVLSLSIMFFTFLSAEVSKQTLDQNDVSYSKYYPHDMDSPDPLTGRSKKAIVREGIIKCATHYYLSNAKTSVWYAPSGSIATPDAPPTSEGLTEVVYGPEALFFGYDPVKKESLFLGTVDIENCDETTLEKLNTMLDPQSKLPTITKAKIGTCFKRGRYVMFLDENGTILDTSCHYDGSIDIRSESEKNILRFLKPRTLLDNLEEVTEPKPLLSYLCALLVGSNTNKCIRYKN